MKLARSAGLALFLALAARPAAAQTVETFEGFGSCDNSTNMGVFNGINYLSEFVCYAYPQSPYNASSGTNRLRINNGITVSYAEFSFLSPTTFQGAWFAGSGPSVYFELYLSNGLVSTSGSLGTSSTPTFLATNYFGNVDKVRLIGGNGQVVLDDLTWGGPTDVVPEPASMTLLATGLGLLGAARRRRQKST